MKKSPFVFLFLAKIIFIQAQNFCLCPELEYFDTLHNPCQIVAIMDCDSACTFTWYYDDIIVPNNNNSYWYISDSGMHRYAISVTVPSGCKDSSIIFIENNECALKTNMANLVQNRESSLVKIYNSNGQIVTTSETNSLLTGIYYEVTRTRNKTFTRKIFITH